MPQFDVIVVGAGIAGSTLAAMLSPHVSLALIDRDIAAIPGSTGHAPGVVAQINSIPALAELARRSVAYYSRIPGGFDPVGGLEVALGAGETTQTLEARAALAHSLGLAAEVLSQEQAAALAPAFVREDAAGAVHFPNDGLANAKGVTRANVLKAKTNGATLLDGNVTAIANESGWKVSVETALADGAPPPDCTESGWRVTVTTGAGTRVLTAAHVAVCTGAWAGQLLPTLDAAAVAVAHPYAFSERRAPRPPPAQTDLLRKPGSLVPFVRFPGQTVYARDHGERDGLGSYAHPPVHVKASSLKTQGSGVAAWEPRFDGWMDASASVLPDETAATFHGPRVAIPRSTKGEGWSVMDAHAVPHAFAGLMTMTPDGMPLCGRMREGAGGTLWAMVGTWVTHAAGTAGVLAPQILAALGKKSLKADDAWLRAALDPHRFDGMGDEEREKHCLDKYADIWNRKEQCIVVGSRPRTGAKL
jgi:glycine/D-amino acid oxidase-like deaminating enzyme